MGPCMIEQLLSRARDTVRSLYGFSGFRPSQEEVIRDILDGHDLLAIMPTGSGKSLCYQIPALVHQDLTLVVSPLIALMRDQVRQLEAFGIAAASLNSTNDEQENAAAFARLRDGSLRLLYIAPERLARPEMQGLLRRSKIARIAVDEAHCVSQWGHDFRPEYLAIGAARQALGNPQMLAFTATADMATREDIARKLYASPPKLHVHGFDRPNLHLAMTPKAATGRQLLAFIERHRGNSGIVYCTSRKATESLRDSLTAAGFPAIAYHAGLAPDERRSAQDRFQVEDGVVMTATVAFGMGIDKPDIRFVAHAGLAKSVEAWYQEVGRAGRDGLPASTLMLYGLEDIRLRRLQIMESDSPPAQKDVEFTRLNALLSLTESISCRRQVLLAYFGETLPERCRNCDLCADGAKPEDATIAIQKALSALLRTGQMFGTGHLVSVLLGEETDAVRRHGHQHLPTFGIGSERDRRGWSGLYRQLYALGLIDIGPERHAGWSITHAGRSALRGEKPILLRRDSAPPRGAKAKARHTPGMEALDADSERLLAALKARRREIAEEANAPAYVIFADRTLIELARDRPRTKDAMRAIHGVGETKLDRYGDAFLEVILGDQP